MLQHWSDTTFGDFILRQECKMIRHAMLISAANTVAIVFDSQAERAALREHFQEMVAQVKAQSTRPIHLIFAEMNTGKGNSSLHKKVYAPHSANTPVPKRQETNKREIQQAAPDYLSHLIDVDTGSHIESGSVDWIILWHAVESATEPRQILREATRVLDIGGRLNVFAFSPVRYLERALWRKMSKAKASVVTELSHWRLNDWLKVLNYEVTQVASLISPLRSMSKKYRRASLQKERVNTFPWLGMVYQLEALKRDIPMTAMRMQVSNKKNMSLRLVRTSQNKLSKNMKLVPVHLKRDDSPDKN